MRLMLRLRPQTPDEKLAFQAVQDAYKQGVNFFDVAPFYGAGSAERVRCNMYMLATIFCPLSRCQCILSLHVPCEAIRARPSQTDTLLTARPLSCAQLLGRCIADLPREDLFICTKVGAIDSCPATPSCCGI